MAEYRKVYGLGAEFDSAGALMQAAEKIRDAGFSKWDVHSPFPIHGMDQAMGHVTKYWVSAARVLRWHHRTPSRRCVLNLHSVPWAVSDHCPRQAVHLGHAAGFLSHHLRAHDSLLGFHDHFRLVDYKPASEVGITRSSIGSGSAARRMTGSSSSSRRGTQRSFPETKACELLEEIGGQHVTLIHD